MSEPAPHRRVALALLSASIAVAAAGVVIGLSGHHAAAVTLVALSVAIATTAVRHHLTREPRR